MGTPVTPATYWFWLRFASDVPSDALLLAGKRLGDCAMASALSLMIALQTTTGVTSDLQQATRLARHMVTQCGMSSEFGPVYVSESGRSSSGFGPETQRRVDNEISRILHDSYSRVQTLLVRPENMWEHVGQGLLKSCSSQLSFCKLHLSEVHLGLLRVFGESQQATAPAP